MDKTLKKLLSSSSFNSFSENPDFNVADALLWIAVGLHKIACALDRANEMKEKELTGEPVTQRMTAEYYPHLKIL